MGTIFNIYVMGVFVAFTFVYALQMDSRIYIPMKQIFWSWICVFKILKKYC